MPTEDGSRQSTGGRRKHGSVQNCDARRMSGDLLPPSLWDFPRPCPLNHGFSLSKQKADNPGDNEVENRADHHTAHSAEQHEDVGLTKQYPDRQSADEGVKDAGDREAPESQMSPLSLMFDCVAAQAKLEGMREHGRTV